MRIPDVSVLKEQIGGVWDILQSKNKLIHYVRWFDLIHSDVLRQHVSLFK